VKELAPRFATYARPIGQSALAVLSSAGVRLVIVWLVMVATARADDAPINPYPRSVIDRSTVAMVDFSQAASADHWEAHNDCTTKIAGGRLVVKATGSDPIVGYLPVGVQGPIEIAFRIRSTAPGGGQFFWTEAARRWALTGLPFVYQWSNRPIMAYATTAVFGATNWIAPNWIGQPVQWCGLTYAESLLLLAEHDQAIDWRKLADGITTCGEQMQYPDGPSIGCLPDSFNPSEQFRLPPDINPCALVSLRMRLRGELDGVAVAVSDRWRVMSPFPVTIDQDQARVEAHAGLTYQLIVFQRKPNPVGSAKPRVVEVVSEGRDQVPLEPPH
jgi:hypothetical protein